MKKAFVFILSGVLMGSCIPDNVKEKLNDGLMVGHRMLADQEFKRAIANIELHRLRTGAYPATLHELKFLSAMDSTMFSYVEYSRLDSGYALNLKMEVPSLSGDAPQKVDLTYPAEFWAGLGCRRSNLK
ncbi:MAG TPA: hypothetical protein VGD31_13705 [Sphingobacteriaceae bacterium]